MTAAAAADARRRGTTRCTTGGGAAAAAAAVPPAAAGKAAAAAPKPRECTGEPMAAAGDAAASTVWARGGGWLPAAAAGGLAAASAAGVWAAGAPPVVVAALVATAMGGGGGGGWVAPPLAVAGLGVWLAAGGARRWDHAGAPWVAIWAAGSPAADGAGVGVAATATGGAVLVLRAVGLLGAVDTAADCPAAWMGLPGAALAGAGGGAPAALARALPTVLLLGTVAALGGVVQAALLGDEGRGEVGRGARHAGRRRNRAGYTPIA